MAEIVYVYMEGCGECERFDTVLIEALKRVPNAKVNKYNVRAPGIHDTCKDFRLPIDSGVPMVVKACDGKFCELESTRTVEDVVAFLK